MRLIRLTDNDLWNEEYNRYEFTYEGYNCMVLRNHEGSLCGYVGLTSDHPSYKETDFNLLHAHWGITFAGYGDITPTGSPWFQLPVSDDNGQTLWWIGFHCSHDGDYRPGYAASIAHEIPNCLPNEMGGYMGTYRDISYVLRCLKGMVHQLQKG